jgi:hypothetical protein
MEYKYLIKTLKPLSVNQIEILDRIGTIIYQSPILSNVIGLQTYVNRNELMLYDFIESVEDIDENYGDLLQNSV